MAKIESFNGTWDPNSYEVTLNWTITDVQGTPTIKVGMYNTFKEVPPNETSAIMAGKQTGSAIYKITVKEPNTMAITKQVTVQFGAVVKKAVVAVQVEEPLENPAFVNTGFEWLTYETVLNKPKFRKTNQARKIGLYAADMANLQLWVRSDFPDGAFQALCASFFPDHTPAEIQRLSDASWWWKQHQKDFESLKAKKAPYYEDIEVIPPEEDTPAWLPESRPELVGSRAVLKIFLPRYAVLPYNFWDNFDGSRSLGTGGSDKLHPIPIIQVKQELGDATSWSMWRTASRSCVMQVSRVKDPYVRWPKKDWKNWLFAPAISQRVEFENKNKDQTQPIYKNTAFKNEVQKTEHLQLRNLTDYYFSVKTGVAYVGFEQQDEKQIIGQGGEWLCGCMRSDTIRAIQQLGKAKMKAAHEDIVIQTEIMMLMERKMSPAMAREKFGIGNQPPGVDGVALRDLSVLSKDKYYIPPLSIPFISKDMKTLSTEFAHIDDPQWCGFWERNWAEALGRAKALFLVQYGMQHANPNVQNYLLEFAISPADAFNNYVNGTAGNQVRVVIRDVADALLVREVAWALFGPDQPCPQDASRGLSEDNAKALAKMRLPILRYNFRKAEQAKENETGSTNEQFGTPGMQFLWNRFSGFYVGNKSKKNVECPTDKLAKALWLTSKWGIAHSAAYVRTVEKALGVEFRDIRWDELYDEDHDPDRFTNATMLPTPDDWEGFSNADVNWEEAAASLIHEFLRDVGRKNICDYHNRGWTDVEPTFTIRLVGSADKPLALKVVYCSEAGTGKILGARITDPAGEIPFFGKSYAEYEFWIASGALRKRTGTDGASRRVGDRVKLDTVRVDGKVTVVTPQAIPIVVGSVVVKDPGQPVSGAAYPLEATATADPSLTIASVRFLLAGKTLPAPVTDTYKTTLDTALLKNGRYKLTAEATDSAGAVTTSTAVTITVENPLPTVAITAPAPGDISGVVPFTANATAGAGMALDCVQFALQGSRTLGSPIAPTPSSSTFTTTLNVAEFKNGDYKIVAIAKDTAGNTKTSDAVAVKVASPLPRVQITSPSAGPVTGTITLTADVQPGTGMALENVQFKIAGFDKGPPLTFPYTMTVNVSELKNGDLLMTAVAKDTAGNMTTSAPVKVKVDNPLPSIAITSPAAGASGTYFVLAADAQPGANMTLRSVQFSVDDTPTGGLLTDAPFQLDEIQLYPGDHTITATVKDKAWNETTSAVVTVKVP